MNDAELIEVLLIALASIAGLSLGLFLVLALDRSRRARSRRLDEIAVRALPAKLRKTAAPALRLQRKETLGGGLVKYLPQRSQLSRRLARAGLAPDPRRYMMTSAGVAIAVAILISLSGAGLAIVLLGGLAGGLLLPHLYLSSKIGSRETQFLTNLPEGIDIIVRGLKAGLPVGESFAAVAREAQEPVASLFAEIVDLVRIGHPIDQAIGKVAETMAVPELRFLGITLSVQKETGGNLGETLQNLSDILRKRRQMKLKIRAVSSEARASAYIIGSLPFAVSAAIFVVNPSYVQQLFEDPRGIIMVAVGLGSICLGAVVMMKLVRFDI